MRANRLRRSALIGVSFFKNIGVVLIDSILLLALPRPSNKPKVLGIARLDDIGDFVIWLKSAEYIRKYYAAHKIILIANNSWSKLAETLPYWDEVASVDVRKFKWNFLYRWMVYKQVRALQLETIIQPTHICCLVTGDSIARFSGAKNRIGSQGDTASQKKGWQKRIANTWYTQLISASPKPLMVIDRNLEFINNLTGFHYEVEPYLIPAAKIPASHFIAPENYFLIFPGSNGRYKIWPKERFASLAQDLKLRTGFAPIICGAASEIELCDWIANYGTGSISIAGKTSLIEIVEIIRKAKFVIGNDSGSIHIAAATNTVSFSILGGGHFGLFLPYPKNWVGEKPHIINYQMPCYGCGWRCQFTASTDAPFPCITHISNSYVLASIETELTKKGMITLAN
jgi:ADP-heptose:LPS heptosyltransferase